MNASIHSHDGKTEEQVERMVGAMGEKGGQNHNTNQTTVQPETSERISTALASLSPPPESKPQGKQPTGPSSHEVRRSWCLS